VKEFLKITHTGSGFIACEMNIGRARVLAIPTLAVLPTGSNFTY
jgi:hypothetical protein